MHIAMHIAKKVSDLFTSPDAPYFQHILIISQQVAPNHKVRVRVGLDNS